MIPDMPRLGLALVTRVPLPNREILTTKCNDDLRVVSIGPLPAETEQHSGTATDR